MWHNQFGENDTFMQALSRFSIKVYFLPGVYLVAIGFTEFWKYFHQVFFMGNILVHHCILFASSVESNFLNTHTLFYLQIFSDNRLFRNTKIHLDASYDATLKIWEDEYLEREWKFYISKRFGTWVTLV